MGSTSHAITWDHFDEKGDWFIMPESKSVRTYEALRSAVSDITAGKGSGGVLLGDLPMEDGDVIRVAIPGARATGDPRRPYEVREDLGMLACYRSEYGHYTEHVLCDVPRDLSRLKVQPGATEGQAVRRHDYSDSDDGLARVRDLVNTVSDFDVSSVSACMGHEFTYVRDLAAVDSLGYDKPKVGALGLREDVPVEAVLRRSCLTAMENETFAAQSEALWASWSEYEEDRDSCPVELDGRIRRDIDDKGLVGWTERLSVRLSWADSIRHDLENWPMMGWTDGEPEDYMLEQMGDRVADVVVDRMHADGDKMRTAVRAETVKSLRAGDRAAIMGRVSKWRELGSRLEKDMRDMRQRDIGYVEKEPVQAGAAAKKDKSAGMASKAPSVKTGHASGRQQTGRRPTLAPVPGQAAARPAKQGMAGKFTLRPVSEQIAAQRARCGNLAVPESGGGTQDGRSLGE